MCCAGWLSLPVAACGAPVANQHNKFGLLVFCTFYFVLAAVLSLVGLTLASTAGEGLVRGGSVASGESSLATAGECFLRGAASQIETAACQRKMKALSTSRMLRLWLYYHRGAAQGVDAHRRRLLDIEEKHTCCGWGPPLRCSPGSFYFNLTADPSEAGTLAIARPDLVWTGNGTTAAGDVGSPVPHWWKHDLDGGSLLLSDLPAVEALQRCSRGHFQGWYAPSQFCLVGEDGQYRSHEAFDDPPDGSRIDDGSGTNLTAGQLDALRPELGHGGCPYMLPVSPSCLAPDSLRPGCAVPFQLEVAGSVAPFAPVALVCGLLHCLTACCQCLLVGLRKETDRLPPRRPVVDPRYYRYGGKRYEHLVDGQIQSIAVNAPENLRVRPPSRLDALEVGTAPDGGVGAIQGREDGATVTDEWRSAGAAEAEQDPLSEDWGKGGQGARSELLDEA